MAEKKSFILYNDISQAVVEELKDPAKIGEFFMAVSAIQNGMECQCKDAAVRMAIAIIKVQFERDNEAYEKRCERNKKVADARWSKLKSRNSVPKVPMVQAGSDTDNDNDSVTDNDIVSPINIVDTNEKENITKENEVEVLVAEEVIPEPKKEAKRFVKPTQEEVVEYFFEKLHATSNVEAIKFFSYYESNGWRVGRNPMKNWHSAASGWWTRNQQQTQSYGTNKYEKSIAEREQQARDFADYFAAKSAAESQGEGRVSHAILLK